MANSEKELKKAREREANWSAAEKEFLRECINRHLSIIENKGNDVSMINKKKNSWKEIRSNMLSAGYNRDIGKMKAQWMRMKISTRKSVSNVKRASIATGNCVIVPELSPEDSIISGMIHQEFEEDVILIDSNCVQSPEMNESLDCQDLEEEELISADKKSDSTAQQCSVDNSQSKQKEKLPSKLQRLRSLPKTASKNSVILERQRQIAKESMDSEEINNLKKQQLTEEIDHQQRMYKLEEVQMKELHTLKLRKLQRQIEHDEELHSIKLGLLCEKKGPDYF